MIKRYFIYLGIFTVSILSFHIVKADTRSDSVDIIHYDISLSIRNLASKSIDGHTAVTCVSKVDGVNYLTLDFLKLNITSIDINGTQQVYSRNDSVLFINLSETKNTNDTFTITVTYNGQPQADPKWGGFIFSGNYAFNLGVGFDVNPHNFGRCWFPCFDNFTTRSSADLHITTDKGYKAVCGGLLISSITNTDSSITWNWSLSSPVPTYLISVSVSRYEFVSSTYNGKSRNIPILLAAQASDTANLKKSFLHLPDALSIFEDSYGDYAFERIGYNMVPFNGGAMEHACNITYPLFAIDGTLAYETLYAHELSHHWWGDLATCKTAEDMWLNEGWASYSEKLFLEKLYNKQTYLNEVKSNHLNVLRYAHIKDGDFRAIAGVPHQYTYGEHVYHKGADAIHTLRTYMGDSAFFAACRSYLSLYAFKDVTTDDLKKHFSQFTSADLDSYFHDWINNKGFCDFKIYSLETDASLNTRVVIQQNLRAADVNYRNVPLTLSFFNTDGTVINKPIIMSSESLDFTFALPFSPVFAAIDLDENISYARSKNTTYVKSTGLTNYADALIGVNVTSLSDSALLHLEHHWTAADQSMCTIPGLYLSNYRYWSIDGIWPENFKATAYLNYDGTTPENFNGGYLDHTLIKQTEDSLVLVWRPNATSFWQIVPDSIAGKQAGILTDKKGRFWLKDLKKGEYALGMFDHTLAGINQKAEIEKQVLIYPNPSKDLLKVELQFAPKNAVITIYDTNGQQVWQGSYSPLLSFMNIDVSSTTKGNYILQVTDGNLKINKKIIIN